MKKVLTMLCILIISNFDVNAQSNLMYSLTRPILGGNLNFVEFDLMNGTETIIRTYLPSELYDFNPESTSFDDQNNRYITIGYSPQNEESIIAIDITNGNIDLTYQSLTEEFFGVECSGSKAYSLTRPILGGNLNFVEFDLMNGTETIIRTYLPSELYDFNPESTSFDDQNNRYITIGYSPQNEESIIAIDITNGNIDLTYQSLTEEFFGVECSSVSGMNINSLSIDYNVIIYPNPFSDQTFIEYLSEDSYIVTICDLKGKKVQEIKGNRGGKTPICRNSLAPGIYFVYLEENGGVLGKKKLIISD